MKPLVSVIIVNWNGMAVLEGCLRSVQSQTYSPLEIIVVDNGSTDRSVAMLREKFSGGIELLENPRNLGFAAGNNVGIRQAHGTYVALLNNDARADPRWVEELVTVVDADPAVGMGASKIYSVEEPGVLDGAGGLLIYRDGLSRARGRLERDHGQYDTIEEVLLPSGCACLYRRAVLDEVGLLDEDFFAYADDTDLGLRARIAGWKCVYVPTAVVHHHYSASAGQYSPLKAFLVERNRIWVAVKTFPLSALLVSPGYTAWRLLLNAYAGISKRGAAGRFAGRYSLPSLGLVALRAYASATARFPRMWRKRKAILRGRKVPYANIHQWLKVYGITARELTLKE